MKKILPFLVAGMLGGVVTLVGSRFLPHNDKSAIASGTEAYVKKVNDVGGNFVSASPLTQDFTDAAEKAVNAVVHIKTTESTAKAQQNQPINPFGQLDEDDFFNLFRGFANRQPRQGTGSGVIISQDGYIITNNHVVEFGDEFEVTLNSEKKYTAKLVGREPKFDLAVLKIDGSGFPTIPYGDSDKAKVGQWVLAVGNPFNLNSTVTAGIISAKGRKLDEGNANKIESYIQTDAPVNPGNSGGALVDAQGRLIGINTAIVTHTGSYEGYSFAIPINLATRVIDDLIKFGSYQRGYLGVTYAPVKDLQEGEADLPSGVKDGIYIQSVGDGGSAQYAGILPGDIITNINGQDVKTADKLLEIVGSAKVGETLNLRINRKGKLMDIPVVLKKDPGKTKTFRNY